MLIKHSKGKRLRNVGGGGWGGIEGVVKVDAEVYGVGVGGKPGETPGAAEDRTARPQAQAPLTTRRRAEQSMRLFQRLQPEFSKHFKESSMLQSLLCSILPLVLTLNW